MAMSGKALPDLGVVKQQASRGEVELQLGKPIATTTLDSGHIVNVYEYDIDNEPSAGRAFVHGALDVVTIGIWEVIGTPIEYFQGEKRQVQVEYDSQDMVVKMEVLSPDEGEKAVSKKKPA